MHRCGGKSGTIRLRSSWRPPSFLSQWYSSVDRGSICRRLFQAVQYSVGVRTMTILSSSAQFPTGMLGMLEGESHDAVTDVLMNLP